MKMRNFIVTPVLISLLTYFTSVDSNPTKIAKWWHTVSTSYPKTDQTIQLFEDMQATYPNLVRVYSVGKTVLGREMIAINLRANINQPRRSLQPQTKIVANMHGDETVGRAISLTLAVDLLRSYVEKDPRAVEILSKTDVHIIPSTNPDGFEAAKEGDCSATVGPPGRNNANRVDLNRNFPRKDANPDGREPEVVNMMKFITTNYFVTSLNLHGGAVVVCYPYDFTAEEGRKAYTPDQDVFYYLAKLYARNHKTLPLDNKQCGFPFPDEGVINAAQWYSVPGGMQDFNYLRSNTFDMTVELSCCKYPKASEILKEWENNKESLYKYIEATHMGIRGYVVDNVGDTVEGAEVMVKGRNKQVKSNERGEYWRLLMPGDYEVAARKGDAELDWVTVSVPEMNDNKWFPVVVNLTITEYLD